jgi:hypothetical protein
VKRAESNVADSSKRKQLAECIAHGAGSEKGGKSDVFIYHIMLKLVYNFCHSSKDSFRFITS